MDNIYINIEDDMMQVFCALSWGVRPTTEYNVSRDCSLLWKEVSRLFDACGLVKIYNWSQDYWGIVSLSVKEAKKIFLFFLHQSFI